MLGSVSDADDAVQEYWLRLSRSDATGVENLQAWFTTGVARVCLDMLRSRRSRREEPLESGIPEPIISSEEGVGPEGEALLADSVGLAVVNGAAGLVVTRHGRLLGVAGFTVAHDKIVEIDLIMDPARLRELDLTDLGD